MLLMVNLSSVNWR